MSRFEKRKNIHDEFWTVIDSVTASPATVDDLPIDALTEDEAEVELIEGTIDAVPADRFDGATCLLVLHFLDRSERLNTLMQIHRRLKPGARLVVAHHSAGTGDAALWLARSAAFADRETLSWEIASATGTAMVAALPLLFASEEEALMREAGFGSIELFYSAFSFKGWVATA